MPLHLASLYKSPGKVKLFLQNGADVDAENLVKDTPLIVATSSNDPIVVQILISFGAHVNTANATGRTPLFYACLNNNPEIVKILLQNGADCNILTHENRSPFCMSLGKMGRDAALMMIRNNLILEPHPLYDTLHLELFSRWQPKDQLLLCYSIDYER